MIPRTLPLLLLSVAFGCDQLDARFAAQRGFRAYEARDYGQAVAAYEEALEQLPAHASLLRNAALSHLALSRQTLEPSQVKEDLGRAIELLKLASTNEPDNLPLQEILFEVFVESARFDEAATYFTQMATHNPDALRLLGLIEVQRGNHLGAVAAMQKRLDLSPNDAQAQGSLAIVVWEWLHAGGPQEPSEGVEVATRGIVAAARAAELDPQDRSVRVYQSLLLRERAKRLTDPEAQRADFEKANALSVQARSEREEP